MLPQLDISRRTLMRNHFSPGHLIFFIVLLGIMMMLIQVELLSFAFSKLGLSPELGFIILLFSLLGSTVNLPVTRIKSCVPMQPFTRPSYWGLLGIPSQPFPNETQIAINFGGCVIPITLSFYLFSHSTLDILSALLGITVISMISYFFSRPVPGFGIGMPILIAPISAALVGWLLNPEHSAVLAYISGTVGVLIGADLLHLKDISRLGTPYASIGGAGTFDGIFITGIVAALLA